jgi:hypothetical protein
VSARKPEGKGTPWRLRYKMDDNIKRDIREIV